jgi:MFS family permease
VVRSLLILSTTGNHRGIHDVTATGPPPPDGAARRLTSQPRLYGWHDPAILAAGCFALAAGFAQFGATAALGDVAKAFGTPQGGDSIAARVGLSGTTLGVGLAIIRLASLGSLPLAGLADRFGRRWTLIGCVALGLALTASASLSPSFWWFVAIFALGRPMLSATNTVAGVVAAEETSSNDRVKAIALVAAGYAVGAGLTALLRGVLGDELGFRGLFALALVPLAATPLIASQLREPERYQRLRTGAALGVTAAEMEGPGTQAPGTQAPGTQAPKASARARRATSQAEADGGLRALWVIGRLRADLRGRLWVLTGLTFAFSFANGPIITLVFLYGENELGMPRSATALMVLAAGPLGLVGLLTGRWAADTLGRRRAAGVAQALAAAAGMITYSGSVAGVIGGYLLIITASAAYGPASAALAAELFPTGVRASVAGWLTAALALGAVAGLVAFGRLTDALSSFGLGAVLVCAPVVVASLLFARLPETVGLELEQSAPE